MTIAERIYRITHRKSISSDAQIPYYWKYSITKIAAKPLRKFFSAVFIPIIPFNNVRIALYRLCGYKIGKNAFIGMRCYLDDMCYDKISIGNNVTISYGVYFACHGRKQGHCTITIDDGAYIGMKATIIAPKDIIIGENAIIGACTLVNKSVPNGCTSVGIPNRILPTK